MKILFLAILFLASIFFARHSHANANQFFSTLTPNQQSNEIETAKIYRPDCFNPKDHDESDICSQESAISVNKESLLISNYQLILSAIGSLGLIMTLFYSFKSVKYAGAQAKIQRETLIADQRAWIKATLNLDGDFELYETGASISVYVLIENIGKTVALNIQTNVRMVDNSSDVKIIFRDFCNECISEHSRYLDASRSLFPGDSYKRPWGVTMDDELGDEVNQKNYLYPHVMVVVTYETIFEADLRQTAFIWTISKRDDGGYGGLIELGDFNIPKDRLVADVTSGSFAN